MRINRFLAGAVASLLALGTVAPAFADNDRHRGHDRREWRDDRRDHNRNDRREARRDWRDDRRHDRREWRDDRRDHRHHHAPPPRVVHRPAYGPVYRPAYRASPGYGWKVGHRYRDYYRGPIYVVNDYNSYHVRRPPRGHQWIRDDRGNLLLVAIATGILAEYVINR